MWVCGWKSGSHPGRSESEASGQPMPAGWSILDIKNILIFLAKTTKDNAIIYFKDYY